MSRNLEENQDVFMKAVEEVQAAALRRLKGIERCPISVHGVTWTAEQKKDPAAAGCLWEDCD